MIEVQVQMFNFANLRFNVTLKNNFISIIENPQVHGLQQSSSVCGWKATYIGITGAAY